MEIKSKQSDEALVNMRASTSIVERCCGVYVCLTYHRLGCKLCRREGLIDGDRVGCDWARATMRRLDTLVSTLSHDELQYMNHIVSILNFDKPT